jgi:hypothetical protein
MSAAGDVNVRRLLENAIQTGAIDPSAKSEREVSNELQNYLEEFLTLGETAEIHLVLDHRTTLLAEARRFSEAGGHEIACVLYATWLEHWVNSLIVAGCAQTGLAPDTATEVIRETSFRGKYTWLPLLLRFPPIHPPHQAAVLRIAELRNRFVHYKWKGTSLDELDVAEERNERERTNGIAAVEKAIAYLLRYESKYVFRGGLSAVKKFTSSRSAAQKKSS